MDIRIRFVFIQIKHSSSICTLNESKTHKIRPFGPGKGGGESTVFGVFGPKSGGGELSTGENLRT